MGVLDGQPVSAAVTNPAFINKNQDDQMPNQLGFIRPLSGPSISDIQQAVNDLFEASGVSEINSGTNYNAASGTILNGDTYQTAFNKLAGKFSPATGHFHTGAAGDGPILNVVRTLAVTGFAGATGDLIIAFGTNMTGSQSANVITLAATGAANSIAVTGNSPITGEAILIAGANITLSQSGQNITIAATGGSVGGTPTVTTLLTGSGTYTTPSGVSYLKIRMIGGGGGGGGVGNIAPTDGGMGGDTTFGTSLLTAGGAEGGGKSQTATLGIGGTVTINSPAITLVALQGGTGCGGSNNPITVQGGDGAGGPFGGAGAGNYGNAGASTGTDAIENSGSGGGAGGGSGTSLYASANGGGAGGYLEAIIPTPDPTYSYTIGAGGTAGVAFAGSGGSGQIIIEEYY